MYVPSSSTFISFLIINYFQLKFRLLFTSVLVTNSLVSFWKWNIYIDQTQMEIYNNQNQFMKNEWKLKKYQPSPIFL